MGILKRVYKKAYGRNKPYSRYNKIGYISDSSIGYMSSSFLKSVNKKRKKRVIAKTGMTNKQYNKHIKNMRIRI
jgi:hypothetical protein